MLKADSVVADVKNTSVPWQDICELAGELRLDSDHPVENFLGADREAWWLQHVVETSLDVALDTGDRATVERMGRIRVFYETVIAWDIAIKPARHARLRADIAGIQAHIQLLLKKKTLSNADYEECWQLDADFHRAFCRSSQHGYLASAVDVVQDKLLGKGRPRTRLDIQDTWDEHEDVLSAVTDPPHDREMILSCVGSHVRSALLRWIADPEFTLPDNWPRGADMDVPALDLDELVHIAKRTVRERLQQAAHSTDAAAVEAGVEGVIRSEAEFAEQISIAGCDRIVESFLLQTLYPDQFVAYRDSYDSIAGYKRLQRTILKYSTDALEVSRYYCGLDPADSRGVVIEFQPAA